MHKQDIDTVTNLILNNEYKLHEDRAPINKKNSDNRVRKTQEGNPNRARANRERSQARPRSNREGEQPRQKTNREGLPTRKISNSEGVPARPRSNREEELNKTRINKKETQNKIKNNRELSQNKEIKQKEIKQEENIQQQKINKKGKHKKEKNIKQKILLLFKILIILISLSIIFIYLFFRTSLFQKYKEIWVETAMSTMSHQYLATWFLSDEEINEILDSLKVVNKEDSNSNEIIIDEPVIEDEIEEKEEIIVEKIKGKNYVGHVLIIPDPTKVKLVDTRKSNRGTQLSEILRNKNAIAGINAGGFTDDGGVGQGHQLCKATIINQKLLYGYKNTKYSLIGLSTDHKLVLGKYTYQEAINAGIESAVEFGPYLIVNGKNQVTNSNSGGIHPRTAIGQRKDGTFVFVVVDGRQPGYSLGTNLLELQNIFNRYDAYNAANLDGGSSSTMCYDGKRINKTSTPMGERYLPNAFIVEK